MIYDPMPAIRLLEYIAMTEFCRHPLKRFTPYGVSVERAS